MKHKANVPKIFVDKDKVYLSYEIISQLNLEPGERLSLFNSDQITYLKFHRPNDRTGLKLKVENKKGLIGFFIKKNQVLPKGSYIFNSYTVKEDSDGNYMSPLRAANL